MVMLMVRHRRDQGPLSLGLADGPVLTALIWVYKSFYALTGLKHMQM